MTPRYVELEPGFSTADTRSLELAFQRDILVLHFVDHTGETCVVEFTGTMAFRWSEDDDDDPSGLTRSDRVYEVEDSPWRARLLKGRYAPPPLRHFKLCFNAMPDFLDVLAVAMKKKEPNQTAQTTPGLRPSVSDL